MELETTTASADVTGEMEPGHAAKSLDKNPGDKEELDFKITTNDSGGEDEALSIAVSKTSEQKAVNGRTFSEEDFESQPIARTTRSKTRSAAAGEKKGQNDSSASSKLKGDSSGDDQQSSSITETLTEADECKGDKSESNGTAEKLPDLDGVNLAGQEEEKPDEKEKADKEEKLRERKRLKCARQGGTDKKELSEKLLNKNDSSRGGVPVGVKSTKNKEKKGLDKNNKKFDDDDVVMISDSPAKETCLVSGPLNRPVISLPTSLSGVSLASSLLLNARSGLPYMASLAGGSFMPSVSGVQFMLPQGTSSSALMYIPNSTAFVSSGPLVFPTVTAVPRNTNPMLLSHYAGMNSSASIRSIMANTLTGKSVSPLAPVFSNMPEKPTSSLGMIDMIRWELENHINVKPKYVKPNPKAELGTLAKWHFDLGADLVKEYVYHDLVRIQLKRKDDGNLTAKEQDDFNKLQDIDKELNEKVGHLKCRLLKSCKCGFKSESDNVLYDHQLRPHVERGGFFSCAFCKFSCRQPNVFRFHLEAEHGRLAKMENKPNFYECPLCPYETNYSNRLEQHKLRCQRQFREAFNLHPSCMTGPEINLSLENVFYFVFTRQFLNSIVPPVSQASAQVQNTAKQVQVTSTAPRPSRMGSTVASSRHLAPRIPQLSVNQSQTSTANLVNRNYPVISTQINTVNTIRNTLTKTSPPGGQQQQQIASHVPAPPGAGQPNSTFEVCEICGGYVKDRKALRIHFFYAHRIDMPFGVFERPQAPLYCATCLSRFWTAQGLQKHIEVHKNEGPSTNSNNGVAGKCISCGHRVPNILMHMRMVHNRELRHYLAALMCIFCGQRCPTKNQVEHHMNKVHGVIVKNSGGVGQPVAPIPPILAPPLNSINSRAPAAMASKPAQQQSKPANGKPGRTSQCVLCNLSFSRNVDLTRHCMRVHHTCMKCGLVVVDKESLNRHTCLHSASGMRTCQICGDSGFHPAYYIKHMRDKHLRKCSVVLRRIDRAVVETLKRPITISDSEDDEAISRPSSTKQAKENDANIEENKNIDNESNSMDKESDSTGTNDNEDAAKKCLDKVIEDKNKSDTSENSFISDKPCEKMHEQKDDSKLLEREEDSCTKSIEKSENKSYDETKTSSSKLKSDFDEKTVPAENDSETRDSDSQISDNESEKNDDKSEVKASHDIRDDNEINVGDSQKSGDKNEEKVGDGKFENNDSDGDSKIVQNEEKASNKRKLSVTKAEMKPSKKTARKSIRPSSNKNGGL